MKTIMTVRGRISVEELGITMPHEHIVADIARSSGNFDNLLTDIELCAEEIKAFKEAGGKTLVDVTTEDIGRDPVALKEISETVGVNIITCTGYYSEKTYPMYVFEKSVNEITTLMINEFKNGIGNTGIRPGIIGEIGSKQPYVTPAEERVLRAAARAHNETGLAITLHSSYGRPAMRQFAILKEEGVRPEGVIVGHVDIVWHRDVNKDLDYFQEIIDAGCWLEFDTIGWKEFSPEEERVRRICLLVSKGYAERILLSSDLCRRSFYHAYGGRGYDYVLHHFVPNLQKHGISDAQINLMLRGNPKEALSF